MGHKDPRGKGFNMKIRTGKLVRTGAERLWKTGRETGKAADPA